MQLLYTAYLFKKCSANWFKRAERSSDPAREGSRPTYFTFDEFDKSQEILFKFSILIVNDKCHRQIYIHRNAFAVIIRHFMSYGHRGLAD